MNIVTNAKAVAHRIRYFLTKSPAAAVSVLEDTAKRIQSRMNVRKPVQYPIRWDSERQRHAFFATNGFGHGIPYKRTSKTVWTLTKPFENEIDLFAPHPAGPVFGRMPDGAWWQSNIHRGTWPHLKSILFEEIARIPQGIRDSLTTLVNESKI